MWSLLNHRLWRPQRYYWRQIRQNWNSGSASFIHASMSTLMWYRMVNLTICAVFVVSWQASSIRKSTRTNYWRHTWMSARDATTSFSWHKIVLNTAMQKPLSLCLSKTNALLTVWKGWKKLWIRHEIEDQGFLFLVHVYIYRELCFTHVLTIYGGPVLSQEVIIWSHS